MYVDFSKSHVFLNDMNAVDSLINQYKHELDDFDFVPFEKAYPHMATKHMESRNVV